jgi:hypothetical protein
VYWYGFIDMVYGKDEGWPMEGDCICWPAGTLPGRDGAPCVAMLVCAPNMERLSRLLDVPICE